MKRMELYDFLRQFNLRPSRPGFFYTAQAVIMISDHPELAEAPMQDLYGKIAKIYGVSCESVDHDIDATLHTIWRHSSKSLPQLYGQPIPRFPQPPKFFQILLSIFTLNHQEPPST